LIWAERGVLMRVALASAKYAVSPRRGSRRIFCPRR
jgi:hypothetical protein